MTYYFASNNQAMFDRSTASIVGSTTASTFDSAVVSSSVLIPALGPTGFGSTLNNYVGLPVVVGGPSLTSRIYGHFELYATTSVINGTTANTFFRIRNNVGQVVFKIDATASSHSALQCQYWNGATFINVGSPFAINPNGLNTYDFTFLPGATGDFSLYLNGSLTPVVSVTNFNVAVTNVAVVDVFNSTSVVAYISQCILADNDLRGAKLNSLLPTGNGFHTDGTGTFTDVNTVVTNDTTGVGLPVVGNRKSFVKANLTTTGMVIDTAFVNIKSGVSGGVVNNARAIVRRASVTTPTSAYSPSPTLGLTQAMLPMAVDPSTGLAWTVANWNASELGIEARA